MIVLGVESSCDETAAALVDDRGVVLADVVRSQIELHAAFGGVVPELAARAHLAVVTAVVREALARAGRTLVDVDHLAVTAGPGLAGALLVGSSFARGLSWSTGLPLVGVDHLAAHLLAVQLRREGEGPPAPYPFVALLVSGGHTGLYRVDSPVDSTLLGQTRDDAAGEAFDKAAKLLGLGYPGGPRIDKLAARGRPGAVTFPAPMARHASLEFSFAGLKTSLARRIEQQGPPVDDEALADLCHGYQAAIVNSLVDRSVAACRDEGVPRLVLAGGVAANRGLRASAAEACAREGIALHVPSLASCTDNAAMVAYAGLQSVQAGLLVDATIYTRDKSRKRGRFARDGSLLSPRRG